ncbi:P-loop containing nucleoside triphosphate hydrolase protein [Obelidium mucronatum]|nr:P-loop containing nucleoside triphosphate hydrolase protein [Obelidium mucronatum]
MRTSITAIVDDSNPQSALQSSPATKSITIVNGDDSRIFQFDQVFLESKEPTRAEILSKSIQPLVQKFLNGMNVTLVLFGTTDSRKSDWFHSPPDSSVLSVFLDTVFTAEGSESVKLEVMALQIYGELVRDMLNSGNETVTLNGEGFNSAFKGFVKRPVYNAPSGMEIMSTIMNYTSDQRKHQLAAVTDCITFESDREIVRSDNSNDSTPERTLSTFTIVNLLGAELLIEDPTHVLLQEGPCVSRSVVSLMNAINTFASPSKTLSFDFTQSNLVQVLNPAFGGNSIAAYLVFLPTSDKWEHSLGVLKVAHKIGKINSHPIAVTTGIRTMIARIQSIAGKDTDTNTLKSQKPSHLQIENQTLKKDFEALQSYVLELTTRLNNLHVTNASLEASCKITEKDRLSMKTELLDSKIELSRGMERLETHNEELSTKLSVTEKKVNKLEAELAVMLSKKAEVEELVKQTMSEKDKVKVQMEQEVKRNTSFNNTIKNLEMKNKELTVELIGLLNNKSNCETPNVIYKSELEKLKKHNEYLKKKIETSQKSSFNMGHEIERLLQNEQEKLRKEVIAHQSLKGRITDLQALNQELTSKLELFKETVAVKESALVHTHTSQVQTLTDRIDKMENDFVSLQTENEQLRVDIVKSEKAVEELMQERSKLQNAVDRLQQDHNLEMERYRSKLERLTADVLAITQKGGKSTDAIITANQLFKQMLDSYIAQEKQLKTELDKARKLLKNPQKQSEVAPVRRPYDNMSLHKKIKEFTMNVQQKLEMDRSRLLSRAIIAEELLKQHAI